MSEIAKKLRQYERPVKHTTIAAVVEDESKLVESLLKASANNSADTETAYHAKILKTPIGSYLAVSNDTHLLLLENIKSKHLQHDINRLCSQNTVVLEHDGESTAQPLLSIENELNQYFDGKLLEFRTPFHIDPSETEFQQSVWHQIHQVKYGKSSSYTDLAVAIGNPKSFRAVANACGRNPISILIPCHRILKADQSLGGYSSGVEQKVWLLNHEKNTLKLR